ncbi:MAG: serine/threonine protein phosphatase [Mesorhizobium sp.]|uniref:metallophosphoesterase family protein n=1 Tax=unclassified Mesorhizobium TaxID=325217 RepID=UPI000FC9D852|nr:MULTISPECIES: metallophosphoesterase family protein [unclassified Mesorhizobium]MCT2580675.1 serine/threonine protein phosphatase [Mesorhizobium sp. P13.3]MDF3169617.1 metallophosphoesterase family protein [Mesorhizobium sp. P16.1]MDF3179531.1 metallophosphoesterase family protein [Mesorhizobium sp. P17.1]MDF3186532.1 metallophosphoesterase family protein [Mesorhizobium sp. ICCV3110.1]RUV63026.1 serine/threonine protein phosphatase [Mesorhizobium sp. M1A.F.Ca.IN.022.02.1.1]
MTEAGIHYLDARGPKGIRIYAIGDVHGRHDLLAAMHSRIASDLEYGPKSDWRIIHLGDYVDRGPDSRNVIEFLIEARSRDPRNIMLAGNHDIGMLDFLAKPDPEGLFMRYGGVQTAASYGVKLSTGSSWFGRSDEALAHGHAALVEAVPQAHVDFLRSLSFSACFGDFFFCHAGIRPGVPLESQNEQDLIWIRDVFHNYPGLYPKVIVHGHTPVPDVDVMANRVNLDTLAWQAGTLSALAVDGAEKRILTVEGMAFWP